ncbi:hypothetical protein [Gudongella oleilytica]|uniref:hypothetical protein n=1 Tax=Gudongella oleilytica TaxID=1582259 RepID=UPI002A3587FF|nr:hypothetical protein [Gudongella oleilytica]MDY0257871.1 hypothetical protein [Gudongella oleilytica]
MEHIAYCESKANELDNLVNGYKSMLIRGAAGRKLPHGRVAIGDIVYLINNDSTGKILAKGIVNFVYHSEKLTRDESERIIDENMHRLKLTTDQRKRWIGKRFLCLVEIENVVTVEPFSYVREKNMDDWIIVEKVQDIMRSK